MVLYGRFSQPYIQYPVNLPGQLLNLLILMNFRQLYVDKIVVFLSDMWQA